MPSIFSPPAGLNRSALSVRLAAWSFYLLTVSACREPEAPIRPLSSQTRPSASPTPAPRVLPSNGVETTIPGSTGFTPKPVDPNEDLEPTQDPEGSGPVADAPLVVPGDAPIAPVAKPVPESLPPAAADGDGAANPPTAPVPSPGPAPKSVRNGRYYLKGVASGRCLDMPFGDAFGYPLIIWDCTQSETQVFTFEHVADKYFKIFSPYLRTAEVRDGVAKLGAVIQQGNGYVDGDYQQFEFELQIDKLTYMIRIRGTDLAWQVSGDAKVNGTVMVVGKASGSSHERFTLIPVP